MKNVFLLLLFILFAVPAFAADNPVDKGNFVVSMPILSYSQASGDLYENTEGDGSTTTSLMAGEYEMGVQYFVIPNLAVGGILGYSRWERDDSSSTTLTFGPMVNYFFKTGNDKLFPYVGAGYIYEKFKYDNGNSTYKSTSSSLVLQGGAAFMLGKNLAVYGEISDSMDSENPDVGKSTDGTVIGITAGIKAFF